MKRKQGTLPITLARSGAQVRVIGNHSPAIAGDEGCVEGFNVSTDHYRIRIGRLAGLARDSVLLTRSEFEVVA